MKPTDIILRIDVRGMSLIEAEQIVKMTNVPDMIQALPGRKCVISMNLEST